MQPNIEKNEEVVLKITDEAGDIRRIRVAPGFDYAMMEAVVDQNYGRGYIMKYKDNDGDLCLLEGSTFSDFVLLGGGADKTFKLYIFDRLASGAQGPAPPEVPGRASTSKTMFQVYLNGIHGWANYDDKQLEMLRTAKDAGERFVSLAYTDDYGNPFRYEVDLLEKKQRNLDTGKVRYIREVNPVKESKRVASLTSVWLPSLFGGCAGKPTVVLQCRETGTALRVALNSGIDTHCGVGKRVTFEITGLDQEKQLVKLRSIVVADNKGFLSSDGTTLECDGDGESESCIFQIVPSGYRFGSMLYHVATGKFVVVDPDSGKAILLAEPSVEDDGEDPGSVFIIRYNAKYNISSFQDPVYEGRARWIRDKTEEYYTFKEFCEFCWENNIKSGPQGSVTGVLAAKVMWSESVKEGASAEEVEAVEKFAEGIKQRRKFSPARPDLLYTFGDILAFTEARDLTYKNITGLDGAKLRWMDMGEQIPPEVPTDDEFEVVNV